MLSLLWSRRGPILVHGEKLARQRKRLWRELDDESLDESSISIKGEVRSENTELELTSDFSNLR